MRVLIYARVSTKSGRQDVSNQLLQLRKYCEFKDYNIIEEVIDNESGMSNTREGFKLIFSKAAKGDYDLLLFWSLDRFSREGSRKTIQYLQRLDESGVKFKSLQEEYIDSTGIFKDAIVALLAALAEQERIRLSERVIAGLERAKLKGKVGGRPSISNRTIRSIKRYKRMGFSNRAIGRILNIDDKTVAKYSKTDYNLHNHYNI